MKTEETTKLEIERVITAPRDRVYAAWTDPAELRKWFGPKEVKLRNLVADVRVGGEFRWDLTNAEGEEMTMRGEFRELQPGRKVVFTWQWEDDELWENHISVVTVELSDRGDGTHLKLTHKQLPSEESRDRHSEGWDSVLDRLADYLTGV
jgi:uncharacterized protein YndB with AHSA1/START domain